MSIFSTKQQTAENLRATIHKDGPEATDWKLRVYTEPTSSVEFEGDQEIFVYASKTIPYDGVLTFTNARRRNVSYRKNSKWNLSIEEVVEMYAERTDATESELLAAIEELR